MKPEKAPSRATVDIIQLCSWAQLYFWRWVNWTLCVKPLNSLLFHTAVNIGYLMSYPWRVTITQSIFLCFMSIFCHFAFITAVLHLGLWTLPNHSQRTEAAADTFTTKGCVDTVCRNSVCPLEVAMWHCSPLEMVLSSSSLFFRVFFVVVNTLWFLLISTAICSRLSNPSFVPVLPWCCY